jgi:hypothetical protein
MVTLILGCGGPSHPAADNTETTGKVEVKMPTTAASDTRAVATEEPAASADLKLAEQAKADAMKKFAESAAQWPAMQAKAADPKSTAAATAAGNVAADQLLAEDKVAAAKVAAQPPVNAAVSQQEAVNRATALIKASAEKLGMEKKANDKSWQAPPPEAKPATPPAPTPKPQPAVEKKSPPNKPAAKKAADKKSADKKPADKKPVD